MDTFQASTDPDFQFNKETDPAVAELYSFISAACARGLTLTCQAWQHYIDATGADFAVDPRQLLDDPNFFEDVTIKTALLEIAGAEACSGGAGTTCTFNADSKWQVTSFTKEDYAYGIGHARFRLFGQEVVTIQQNGAKRVDFDYSIQLYKDWNFDAGKVAQPKPFGFSMSIPLAPFAALPAKGYAQEFSMTGYSGGFSDYTTIG